MRYKALLLVLVAVLLAAPTAARSPKIVLGKALDVKLFAGASAHQTIDATVRPIYVNGKLKEFTIGEPHDVTDTTFVIQQAFRVNDALPEDSAKVPTWRWQRGPWLVVDRTNGRISRLNLPDFDPYYSAAAWFRDMAAYCGTAESGQKLYAVVAQVQVKRPILRHPLGITASDDAPDSECTQPKWQRDPARVTFFPKRSQQVTFEIRGRAVEVGEAEKQP